MAKTSRTKKIVVIGACAVLVIGIVTGVLAYLTDTDSAQNTFTVGKVEITLTETVPENNTAQLTPGTDIAKDPKLTVKANSVACWVFVKVDPSENASNFLTYSIASGWTQGDGTSIPANVYYKEQAETSQDTTYSILANDQVHIKDTVTEEMISSLTEKTYPTLSFKGYAIQKSKGEGGQFSAAEAWAEVSK